eukprot:TRINITY_DN1341_c0_g1_i18.p1 TRINITY_DN1341_c0_g1~~TRINITY_DN1341_c0_g1_i18.p1  ORF type:complete len:145 (+),score=40.73 TRINITY_DN1341_c0_g1_i18:511-945(+)
MLQDIIFYKREKSTKIVGIAKEPNLFMLSVDMKQLVKSSNEGLINYFFSFFGPSASSDEEKGKSRRFISLSPEKSIHVDYQDVCRIRLDQSGTLAMISEGRGRVLLADLEYMIIIKVWKGVRDCWMAFSPVSYTHLTLPTNREV